MTKNMKKTAIAAAVLLLAGAGGYYAVSEVAEPDAAEQAAAVSLELPLDSYRLTEADQLTYDRALGLLVGRCMADADFSWYVPDDPPPPQDRNHRRYGVIHPDVAQRYGYHPPPVEGSAHTREQRSGILQDPGAETAYFGPEDSPEEGCAARAERRLDRGAGGNGAADEAGAELLTELGWSSLDTSETHPDVVEAKNAWQECMSSRGHSYTTPRKAIEDESWNLDSPSPSAAERAVAVADVECKYEVGMVETWVQAERGIQREMVAEHTRELEALRHANEVRHDNAEAVLAEAGEA